MTSILTFCQDIKFSEKEIKNKLDSIKTEGNLLYSFEKASWNSNDIARKNVEIKDLIGAYLTYQNEEFVRTVFLNKSGSEIIAEYNFKNKAEIPTKINLEVRSLSKIEIDLKNVRQNLISYFSNPANEVGAPKGFSLNIITIPFGANFKTYLIPGTSQSNVIPFGNDYLFITDNNGKILNKKKFHSAMIPVFGSDDEGNFSASSTHSHLKENPFLSATDICTFRLYAPFTKLTKFSVFSPGLKKTFEYNMIENTLEIVKNPF